MFLPAGTATIGRGTRLNNKARLEVLFNIEHDSGDVIEGYVIPDGFSEQPSILVSAPEGPLARLVCDQLRYPVVESGRHESGMVGFKLDSANVPNLAGREVLSIHDAKSGLLIYRRTPARGRKNLKIVRVETQIIPFTRLDRFCGAGFQYELYSAERFGHETTLQAFHLHTVDSIFISGRVLMKNYEGFLDRGFQAVVLLTDPYYEMAARIFLLKKMSQSKVTFLGERDQIILAPAAEYFAGVELNDRGSLKSALKRAPQKVRNVLMSPVTRQLVCSTPEQSVTRADVAAAIDLLSRFTVVGHDSDLTVFQLALAELLNCRPEDIPLPSRHVLLEDLAVQLRELPAAEPLVEHDLIFDHYVRQALEQRKFEA